MAYNHTTPRSTRCIGLSKMLKEVIEHSWCPPRIEWNCGCTDICLCKPNFVRPLLVQQARADRQRARRLQKMLGAFRRTPLSDEVEFQEFCAQVWNFYVSTW